MASTRSFDLVGAAETLLEDAKRLARTEKSGTSKDESELRETIAQTASKIAFAAAAPIDAIKADWVVIAQVAVCELFIQWRVFDHIPADGHIPIRDLAQAVNAQESLVARLSALLLATGHLLPGPHPDTLAHSRVSRLLVSSSPVAPLVTVAVGNGMKPYAHWPEFFDVDQGDDEDGNLDDDHEDNGPLQDEQDMHRNPQHRTQQSQQGEQRQKPRQNEDRRSRREPRGQNDTPFSFAWGHPRLPPWEVKALYPRYARAFARSMEAREMVGGGMRLAPAAEGAAAARGVLYDMSWIGREAAKKEGEAAAAVDVGGGLGQLIKDVLRDVPGVRPAQCVLQDRAEVIERARTAPEGGGLEGVVMMEHDFHRAQPVKGALVYFLRRILLDYSDELATGILRHLADALPVDNPAARVLIIEERRLDPPTPMNCIVDLVMLNLGGKLRNEAMFRDIAAAAGLKVVGYHVRDGEPLCVVECALA